MITTGAVSAPHYLTNGVSPRRHTATDDFADTLSSLVLWRVPTRSRLPTDALVLHGPILLSKVRRLQATQGGSHLYLGNLDAVRDWGYVKEYVEGMWPMLQADAPQDYVLATGETATVLDFVKVSFDQAGLEWDKPVRIDSAYERPSEVDSLIGDATKVQRELGGEAQTNWERLARLMVDADRSAAA